MSENLKLRRLKEKISQLIDDYEAKMRQHPTEIDELRDRCNQQQNMIRELERFIQIKKMEEPQGFDEKFNLEKENQILKKKQQENEGTIELLKTQLIIYKEDFDNERKDRERSNDKVVELEKQIANFLDWYNQIPNDLISRNLPTPIILAPRQRSASSQIISFQQQPQHQQLHPIPTVTVRPSPKDRQLDLVESPNDYDKAAAVADTGGYYREVAALETLDSASIYDKIPDESDVAFGKAMRTDYDDGRGETSSFENIDNDAARETPYNVCWKKYPLFDHFGSFDKTELDKALTKMVNLDKASDDFYRTKLGDNDKNKFGEFDMTKYDDFYRTNLDGNDKKNLINNVKNNLADFDMANYDDFYRTKLDNNDKKKLDNLDMTKYDNFDISNFDGSRIIGRGSLQCYNCQATFERDAYAKLIQHMDNCAVYRLDRGGRQFKNAETRS